MIQAHMKEAVQAARHAKVTIAHTVMAFERYAQHLSAEAHNTARMAADVLDDETHHLEEAIEQIALLT